MKVVGATILLLLLTAGLDRSRMAGQQGACQDPGVGCPLTSPGGGVVDYFHYYESPSSCWNSLYPGQCVCIRLACKFQWGMCNNVKDAGKGNWDYGTDLGCLYVGGCSQA